MEILCCIDQNYLMPLCVTMVSIYENNKGTDMTVHVIGKGLKDCHKKTVSDIANRYNQKVCFYDIDNELLKSLPSVHGYLTNATYIRLFIANILPLSVKKVLYMDNDVIVNDNLEELWNTDIEGHPCGVVLDSYAYNINHYNRLHYPMSKGYFNAGVMLINVRYWREHKIMEQAMDFATKYPERVYMADQDIMNYLFQDSKIVLPLKYNAICTCFFKKKEFPFEIWEELRDAQKHPVIIHFTWIKPWFFEGQDHPYAAEFHRFLSLTPWNKMHLRYFYKGTKRYKNKLKFVLNKIGLKQIDSPYLKKDEL